MDTSFPCILDGELHPMGMSAAAAESSQHDLLSKAGFRRAVEVLAGAPGSAALDGDDMATVFMSCPCDIWKQTFGEPKFIRAYRGVVSDLPVEVWEHPCSDGVVHCVGHFPDDPYDGQWVILTRVCFF